MIPTTAPCYTLFISTHQLITIASHDVQLKQKGIRLLIRKSNNLCCHVVLKNFVFTHFVDIISWGGINSEPVKRIISQQHMLSFLINKSTSGKDMNFLRLFLGYLLLTLLANFSSAASVSTPELSVLTFNPAKNSKTMPVGNNIDLTYGSAIKKGDGVITLKDSTGNTVESYQAGSSSNISIAGSVLSINPTAILASDKTYSINIPAGALQDTTGNNFEEVIDYEFKTQIDVAFMLHGYSGTTLYETTDSFAAQAELAMTQMGLLSFNRMNSYRTHMLPISARDGEYAQSKAEIEAIDSALDNWGSDDVLSNFYYGNKRNPNALQDPTPEQISVLTALRLWLVENEKGAVNWKDTELGEEHYEWIFEKVLLVCSPAVRFMLDGLRMPAGFDVKEYRAIAIILSSDDSYNAGAAMSSFNSWGGKHWNISNSDGVEYTQYQPFFFDDHSVLFSGGDLEKEKIANAKVDVHELIHTQGGGHDQDPSCISPYSVMSACDTGDFFTYPIYNRIYIMGWLPETAITTNPLLVQDSYNATDPTKKYLLKLGDFRYQELFNGTWYQYRVPSFAKTLELCKLGAGVFGDDGNSVDPLGTCGQLVVDKSCIVSTSFYDNELEMNMTMRDFQACEFIDPENDLSSELFAKFLSRLDGSAQDYSGAVDREALKMEQTDDAARLALVPPDSDGDGVEDGLDTFPLDASESVDTDSDGIGNNADPDDDGDGVEDSADLFPLNGLYSLDSDSDGMPDAWETKYGLDPSDATDAMSDQDNDGVTALDEFLAGTIPSGSLDIDGNAQYDALTDGLLLLRGMFGLDGDALVTGTVASDALYTESVDIESRIATLGDLADIDGNGTIDALTDGLLTLRYLFGLEGETLIAGVVAADATRTTAVDIEAHLKTLMPSL